MNRFIRAPANRAEIISRESHQAQRFHTARVKLRSPDAQQGGRLYPRLRTRLCNATTDAMCQFPTSEGCRTSSSSNSCSVRFSPSKEIFDRPQGINSWNNLASFDG